MDPHAAGHPGNPRPVETQPQWQSTPAPSHQNQLYNPRAVVPPGLERLVGVEEVILQKKAFFTRSEQTLFTICQESECCGPAFNLRFQDPYKRDVVSLYAESEGDCCGGETHLKITVFPASTIGFINIQNSSRKMSVSIQMAGKPAFTAELPLSRSEKMIEILSANGSCPVATITTEGKKKSSKVVFRFPMDMEATLKTLILAAFLYMKYQLGKLSGSSRSLAYDSGWDTAGGMFFHHNDPHLRGHGGFNGDCGDGGFSGGYCGGVDSGGRGGDSGGGGGDCGGGGGDSGGGGGDSGGGGGDCGGGGGDCGGGGGGCD